MTKEIELTQGYKAIVDDEDYERVNVKKWYIRKWKRNDKMYAERKETLDGKVITLMMHRFVMNEPSKEFDIDHIDGNGLNNQKENLRICTRSQNCMNKRVRKDSGTGYKGVYEVKKDHKKLLGPNAKRFEAYIGIPETSGERLFLGRYHTLREAVIIYNNKAVELFGEYVLLNDIPDDL